MPSTQYLFLFTIGSPQAFIAQARKTHDLFAGSKIISDLIDAAMVAVGKNNVIFPDANSDAKPNRFLAKIPTDIIPDGNINAFCKSVETAARKEWLLIAVKAFENAKLTNGQAVIDKSLLDMLPIESCQDVLAEISKIAEKQLIEFPDIYWGALPLSDTKDYKDIHDKLNTLIGGIKNIRKFYQLHEPAGRKCSLDGERNAIIYNADKTGKRPPFMDWDTDEPYQKQIHKIPNAVAFKLNPKEALSAVSLVKRFYKCKENSEDKPFPSTAQIALMNVIDEKEQKVAYYKTLFNSSFDFQLFYEENLLDSYIQKQGVELTSGITIKKVCGFCKDLTQKKKSRYYALLLFDGDNFGKLWSGNDLEDKSELEMFQRQLAKHLKTFADMARNILTPPRGKTVYTGGDDFLGFVNLQYLFTVMKELHEAFFVMVETPIKKKFKESFIGAITFTAGVAIAHYKEPLSVVLAEARDAEKAAKNTFESDDKNAFALSVLKHSGESLRCLFKWQDKESYLTDALDYVVKKRNDKNGFSNTFINNIDKEFSSLMDDAKNCPENDMIEAEIKRLLARSAIAKSKEQRERETKDMLPVVMKLYNNLDMTNTANFFSALHICDFIKRETFDEHNY